VDRQYDNARWSFARKFIDSEVYQDFKPAHRPNYPEFGTRSDSLEKRLSHRRGSQPLPLTRAHVGPYSRNCLEALKEFESWCKILGQEALLDVLSVGTSQLTQEAFGEKWNDWPNGGGVPINSEAAFRHVWNSSRPMLVRTYAGTQKMPELAALYDKTINNAWHTFSFWWFCQIDGRGPLDLLGNLKMHLEALRYVASKAKAFEPNIPHHFSFRGSDDVTYVLSGFLAARTAKAYGVRTLICQNMLNTPKYTWGIQDLAKARAYLKLLRSLEDRNFRIVYQPRAGLDYFSHDLHKAKIQLACVTALMDDVESLTDLSPEIIHVVSYSEASHLADAQIVNESCRITLSSLQAYRKMKLKSGIAELYESPEVEYRAEEILEHCRARLKLMDNLKIDTTTVEGLYDVFKNGFLPTPQLWGQREFFPAATSLATRLLGGSVKLVGEDETPLSASDHILILKANWENSSIAYVSRA